MAACTAALFGFDERQVGALFGGLKWFCRGTFHCVFVTHFFVWPFHVRQRAPNTVSHSCAMSACESQGECHWSSHQVEIERIESQPMEFIGNSYAAAIYYIMVINLN